MAAVAPVAVALLLAAAADAARPPQSFFGVTPQRGLDSADLDRMARAGVGAVRFELNWANTDRLYGLAFDWTASDRFVGDAAGHGIKALPFAFGTPPWVARQDGIQCDGCGTFAPHGDAALAAWKGFLSAAVRRYGPDGSFWAENPYIPKVPIRVWQLWNEQNSPAFYSPKPNVREYAELLHAGSEAILAEDPGAEIVLGGMFGTPQGGRKPSISAWHFLAELYEAGSKRDFDTVAAHPYGARFADVRGQIGLLRAEMRRANDRRAGLRVTEIGWASGGIDHPLNRGLKGQAKRLSKAFGFLVKRRKKLNVRGIDWYSWRDYSAGSAVLCSWCPYSGLLDDDLDPKPALRAFTKFTGGN